MLGLAIHAPLACMWLSVYAIQCVLMYMKRGDLHKFFGRFVAMPVGFANIFGMFFFCYWDYVHHMPDSPRPPAFSPFMFIVACVMLQCLTQAVIAIRRGDTCMHKIWVYRCFMWSFTTPVIRLYPFVLRTVFGQDCFETVRDEMVMGAMLVAALTMNIHLWWMQTSVVASAVGRKRKFKIFSTWHLFTTFFLVFAHIMETNFAMQHGWFHVGVMRCWWSEQGFDAYAFLQFDIVKFVLQTLTIHGPLLLVGYQFYIGGMHDGWFKGLPSAFF